MRKRQEGGDKAKEYECGVVFLTPSTRRDDAIDATYTCLHRYFNCTQSVAGVQDTRFQALMPDVLHWLGITKIHNFISMSDMKYNAIVESGIKIVNRVEIPPEMVPKDAQVEIAAKVFHRYIPFAFRFLLGSQPTCENDPEPVWLYDWVSPPWLFSQAGGVSSYPMYISFCQLRSRQFATRGFKVKSRAI